jgi:hypothetical protein
MNLKALLQDPVIGKKVYDKFPVSKAEKRCDIEKATMDNLRLNYAKKLYDEMNIVGKREYK